MYKVCTFGWYFHQCKWRRVSAGVSSLSRVFSSSPEAFILDVVSCSKRDCHLSYQWQVRLYFVICLVQLSFRQFRHQAHKRENATSCRLSASTPRRFHNNSFSTIECKTRKNLNQFFRSGICDKFKVFFDV